MGDPHNPARYGERWDPERFAVLAAEIDAVKDHGVLSGGWAWHFMSPPHVEEKHLHDHRDIDLHVFPSHFAQLVALLDARGYHRQRTRFDDPSGEFIRYEKHVLPCPECRGHGEPYERELVANAVERERYLCPDCNHLFVDPAAVKVIFDLFVHEVAHVESAGHYVCEPVLMLSFYGVKHSSEQCVAVQAARAIAAEGGEIIGNPRLVGDWGL